MLDSEKAKIRDRLMQNHDVAQLTKLGRKLLEETERPNIISLAEFEPFIDLYTVDTERYANDKAYSSRLDDLFLRFKRELGINLFQPTIVKLDKTDPKSPELYFLNRIMTRIKGDVTDGVSLRDGVPSAVPVSSAVTVEQMVLEATLRDILSANSTPEQKAHFRKIRQDSALIEYNFVMRNLSPEKRDALLAKMKPQEATPTEIPAGSGDVEFELDDD